jgi:hypothetical protein
MALPSLSGSARNDGSCKVQFIRARLTFATPNLLGAALKIGRLPARAFIAQVSLHKEVVFNSTTSDTISLGTTTATTTEILAATDVHAATGFSNLTAAAGLGLAATGTADVDVFAKWTSGGGVPSTGDVTFIIAFVADNDN